MTSFPLGMARLVERLSENLAPERELKLNTKVTSVKRKSGGWEVQADGIEFTAKNVVFCLPINATLQLLGPVVPTLPLKSIPETRISTVVFGFEDSVTIPPGFGFLTPEVEDRFTLGSLFSSNMFPGRAPKGHVVFETLVGGRRHPERLELGHNTLTQKALVDVKQILHITKEPVYTTVLQSDGGIPQLERNYPELLKWKNDMQEKDRNLFICGFGWDGIGLNDMMKHGTRVAEALISSAGKKYEVELKGVYF